MPVAVRLASLAMGEQRPKMMGTPGFMAPEVLDDFVLTHESQDIYAMGAMALLVCMSPDKLQQSMLISPVREGERQEKRNRPADREAKSIPPYRGVLHVAMVWSMVHPRLASNTVGGRLATSDLFLLSDRPH